MVAPHSNLNQRSDASPDPTPPAGELEQRLGLYQVFLKLYEHHRELLDEILELEDSAHHRVRDVWQFVQAGRHGNQVYLLTNLLDGKTMKLFQPQYAWVIGRDRHVGLPVQDKRLSRRHAMIQYVSGQGFYLVDLGSTNGTYLNGEQVRRAMLLQDGDRVRLGSLSFVFFQDSGTRKLDPLPADMAQYLIPDPSDEAADNVDLKLTIPSIPIPPMEALSDASNIAGLVEDAAGDISKETFVFAKPSLSGDPLGGDDAEALSTDQKAEILDRFLNRS